MASEFDQESRRQFYDLYIRMMGERNEIEYLLRCCLDHYQVTKEKAYWYANISSGLNGDEYSTLNPTFEKFLLERGIMDKDGEFIEQPEEEEEEEED